MPDSNIVQKLRSWPRQELGFFPTPVMELEKLSAWLGGPRIFMKRDDQSGLALGGNKVRKLEFLIGQALDQGADTVVTGGAAQSNHCRQTAAACAVAGLSCHLALGGEEPAHYQGNLLLDRLLGAHLHWCGEDRKGEQIPVLCEQLRQAGKKPFVVPYGGSNAIGALGFTAAIGELALQIEQGLPEFSHLIFASSSGGTHAGMLLGLNVFHQSFKLLGVGIDKEDMQGTRLDMYIKELARQSAECLGVSTDLSEDGLSLEMQYAEPGYGVVTDQEREALTVLARLEGILLDPVYTGRAMAGLFDMIRSGRLDKGNTVLFWHTGGTPALFAGQ